MLRLVALIATFLLPSILFAESSTAATSPTTAQPRLLLLFTGTWDAASIELLDRTLPDRRLQTFLAEKIAVSRHDVLTSPALTRTHHIRFVPTLVLLAADGTELDRWTGPQKPSALLRDLNNALAGKTSLTQRRAGLDADDLKDHLALADDLVTDGRFSAALEEYLHVLHQLDDRVAKKKRPLITGPHEYQIYRDLGKLAKLHPPAAEALRTRRNTFATSVLARPDKRSTDVYDVAQIDRQLNDPDATLTFFQQLPPASKARDRLRFDVFKILIERQAWFDAAGVLTAAELIETRGKYIEPPTTAKVAMYTVAPHRAGEFLDGYRKFVLTEWTLYVEAHAARQDRQSVLTLVNFIFEHDKNKDAPALITAAVQRALGLNADAFLRSLEIPSLPAPPPAVAAVPADTPEPEATAAPTDPDLVELAPFQVSAQARGLFPFAGRWQSNGFGDKTKTPITVVKVHPRAAGLLHEGDRILAIDGKSVIGLPKKELFQRSSEGDAGDTVTFIVQGQNLDDALYREVTVKRIAPPKPSAPKP